MTAELSALVITIASIGFLHTVLGPDHYLLFIMMSWAVLLAGTGVNFLPLAKVQRFAHVIAGATILLCGLAIQFLGL